MTRNEINKLLAAKNAPALAQLMENQNNLHARLLQIERILNESLMIPNPRDLIGRAKNWFKQLRQAG